MAICSAWTRNTGFQDEEDFFLEKRADLLLVTTLDKLHVRQAIKGLSLGYNILLEKPISSDPKELQALDQAQKKSGRLVMVCHVLRYTAMIAKVREILDSHVLGKIVSIDHTENVVYWHEAHSYVRGNWRRSEDTTPMIMAKCCHDLDLLQYFIGSRCKAVSSMGSLSFFKKENKPAGATPRCLDCPYHTSCTYSAERIYMGMWNAHGRPANLWPIGAITDTVPQTEEAIYKSLRESPYGRCVFDCDNDVVDNQTTIMSFENGVTATLKMEAFVKDGGRSIRFFGTEGELDVEEDRDQIVLKPFVGENTVIKISTLDQSKEQGQHGNGDHRIIDKLYSCLMGESDVTTSLDKSLESHYMAIAAEESRLEGGQLVLLSKYRK
jgi:predicted dehydrogenase